MWKVSDVMEVSIPDGVGYGFNVTREGRKPLVLFAYDEQEAAEAAAQQVAAALERAVLVNLFPQ
jgi:GAF domain-containing protein